MPICNKMIKVSLFPLYYYSVKPSFIRRFFSCHNKLKVPKVCSDLKLWKKQIYYFLTLDTSNLVAALPHAAICYVQKVRFFETYYTRVYFLRMIKSYYIIFFAEKFIRGLAFGLR